MAQDNNFENEAIVLFSLAGLSVEGKTYELARCAKEESRKAIDRGDSLRALLN